MSWINDIAGKAEDFLNKLDHGAATVLNKEKKNKTKLNQVICDNIEVDKPIIKAHYSPPPVKKPSPTHALSPLEEKSQPIKKQNDDDTILNYLNNSEVDIDSLQIVSEVKPESTDNGICKVEVENEKTDTHRNYESELLRNEVRSLTSEVSLLMARTKASERELALTKSLLLKKEGEVIVLEKEIQSLKQRFANLELENSELYTANLSLKKQCKKEETSNDEFCNESKLSELQLEAQRKEESLKGDIAALRIRLNEVEEKLLKEKSEYTIELSEVNRRLTESRKELEEYRAKAQWTLSEKEKLIAALRSDQSAQLPSLEIQQLREERDKLEEELEETRGKLERSRKEELEAERRLEASREEATAALRSSQARLSEETARRLAAEEHSKAHAEELHSVREELWRQVGSLNSRLKERERELSRLRRQLSERVVTRPEPELTAALVQKQEAIEQLTIEINQLRLQLERVKLSYGQELSKHCERVSVNDTDDAKAQVPLLMLNSGMERSVRRACSCIDALSRGVFLRRHPFARLTLFFYLVILHIWLCIVLFSYTPDTHSNV